MQIVRAESAHLDELAPLFDLYRQFYGQSSNEAAAREYLEQRMHAAESVVFIAMENGRGVGFTQLYPTFSSISIKRSLILNDLFVHSDFRRRGIAEKLLHAAKSYAIETGAKALSLSTASDNESAQRLYESFGFEKDTSFFHYDLLVN
ncbi:GNAT family N-acetyltransferase [Cohnella faecalis]|uniref:GNAT family N-acetyltransferase n=1 Tax=Cohnella faecalis TaxID=2315694 RepID=A0A398CNG7_9BACL|nr:GNAT family N-acetyltransferase [Cohnella faecalis]